MLEKKDYRELRTAILGIDDKNAGNYRTLNGTYHYEDFSLTIDYMKKDSFRHTSRLRASMSLGKAKFPHDIFTPKIREIAARDFITRRFGSIAGKYSITSSGIKGGRISIAKPGNELLETSAVVVGNDTIEIRFFVDLPVQKGKVSGRTAAELFMNRIPGIIRDSLIFENLDGESLADLVETAEDAGYIREKLVEHGLVSFIANGSVLPRSHQTDKKKIVPFSSPKELSITFDLPNRGAVRGMGIPAGITLIVGGLSQGKTTLLRAIELGVYDHIYGDGRELVVTVPYAVDIRVEEGRKTEKVDISPLLGFVSNSDPNNRYSSRSTSPMVSIAVNISEALEIGASLLTFDDESMLSVLLGRDSRMQTLVPKEDERLTPLVDILPKLRDEHGISSIVVGATGDFFDFADTVIEMKDFKASDVTGKAKKIAREHPNKRISEYPGDFPFPDERCPLTGSFEPIKSEKDERVLPNERGFVQYGDEYIDVRKVSQLVSQSQARAISRGIALVYRLMDSSNSLKDVVNKVINRVDSVGLDTLSNRLMGDLASFRPYELAAAINRMKNLKIK